MNPPPPKAVLKSTMLVYRQRLIKFIYLDVEPTHLHFVKDPLVIVIITKVENHWFDSISNSLSNYPVSGSILGSEDTEQRRQKCSLWPQGDCPLVGVMTNS